MRWVLVACVATACGGSSKHGPTVDPERARIEAMEPPSPYVTQSVRGYTSPTACSQGPFRIEASALGAHFGEQLEVSICAPRSLQGDYQFTKGTDRDEVKHFGDRNNSEKCLPTADELARYGAVSGGASGGGGTSVASGGGGATSQSSRATSVASATAASAPVQLAEVSGTVAEKCPHGTYLSGILYYTIVSSGDHEAWKQGMSLVLDVWSTEPLDLTGAVFVVIQRGVRADMTADAWKKYNEDWDRWNKLWNAYLDGEVTAGRATLVDNTARSSAAPPPARTEVKPPKPSVHAEWIAGFWQLRGEWIWSAGFWRVPESDIVAEQTVEAPIAPPPPKAEAPPPPPAPPASPPPAPTVTASATVTVTPPAPAATANLVWTPGYWAWNGTAYIWIEGAWRIPPQANARWVAPTWQPRRGRVVMVPGGWSVSVHIGR